MPHKTLSLPLSKGGRPRNPGSAGKTLSFYASEEEELKLNQLVKYRQFGKNRSKVVVAAIAALHAQLSESFSANSN